MLIPDHPLTLTENGKKLGTHKGGFTPYFEVSELLKEKDNFLILKVDNKRKREEVPTLNTDWWNYGGITREVKLIEVPEVFIQDYFLQLDPEDKHQLKGFVKVDGVSQAGQQVELNIPELKINHIVIVDEQGLHPCS
jgi:beta-glucuronidase